MIPDYRHVPSSPWMWEEPDTGPDGLVSSFLVLHWLFPTAATCHVCKKCHQTWAKYEVERVSNGWISWRALDLSARILEQTHMWKRHLSDKWCSGARCVLKHTFWKLFNNHFAQVWLRRSLTPFEPFHLFSFWWSNFCIANLLRVSLSCLPLHGFAVKSVWFAVPMELGLTLSFLSTLWLKGSPCW